MLNPPRIPAAPLPVAAPMQADDGRETVSVFDLPQPGLHWTETADYRAGDRPLWRIYSQRSPREEVLDPTVGLSRVAWQSNVAWLEEPGYFLDQSLRWIAGGRKEKAGCVGASATESAVISFIAPEPGEYLLEVTVEAAGGYSRRDKLVGMNVVHFPSDMPHGSSLLFWQATPDTPAETLRATVRLAGEEEVAFVFLPHEVGGGAFMRGFSARFGLLR